MLKYFTCDEGICHVTSLQIRDIFVHIFFLFTTNKKFSINCRPRFHVDRCFESYQRTKTWL